MATHAMTGGPSGLPLSLLAQAIPMLSRNDLEALTERLIDRLDQIDGNPDDEDSDEDRAVDDIGCDDADQGDAEYDEASAIRLIYGNDQRQVMQHTPIGLMPRFRHEH